MKINFEKTYQNCQIYNRSELARQCGVTGTLVAAVILGKYKQMNSPAATRVINRLRDLGALVEEAE